MTLRLRALHVDFRDMVSQDWCSSLYLETPLIYTYGVLCFSNAFRVPDVFCSPYVFQEKYENPSDIKLHRLCSFPTDPKVLGWYHRSWDTEPPLQTPPGQERKVLERCLGVGESRLLHWEVWVDLIVLNALYDSQYVYIIYHYIHMRYVFCISINAHIGNHEKDGNSVQYMICYTYMFFAEHNQYTYVYMFIYLSASG